MHSTVFLFFLSALSTDFGHEVLPQSQYKYVKYGFYIKHDLMGACLDIFILPYDFAGT